ncbi:MAG: hypothetical protein RIB84_13415 [Sneathiellaceae bacterium]
MSDGTSLQEGYAAWQAGVEAWLRRVDACIAGRLMKQDVAALRDEFVPLSRQLADLGRRLRRAGRHPGAAPIDLGALDGEISRQLTELGDRILAQFPAPGAVGLDASAPSEFNLPAAVDLLTFLEHASTQLVRRHSKQARRRRLAVQLLALGERYHRQVMDGFAALEKADRQEPEEGEEEGEAIVLSQDGSAAAGRDSLRDANFNQIRMDLLQWLLEELGDPGAAHQIRHLSRITARAAVRRVDRDLVAYLEVHEAETRVRLRPVLEEVDEVLALIRSVLQQSEQDGSQLQNFVRDLGAEVTEPFIRHMGLLVIALLEDLQSSHGQGGMSAGALRGGLQRIEEVLVFCRVIDHPQGRDAYARAVRVIGQRGDRLVEELGQAVAAGDTARMAEARTALLVLKEFVERWRDDAHRAEGGRNDHKGL